MRSSPAGQETLPPAIPSATRQGRSLDGQRKRESRKCALTPGDGSPPIPTDTETNKRILSQSQRKPTENPVEKSQKVCTHRNRAEGKLILLTLFFDISDSRLLNWFSYSYFCCPLFSLFSKEERAKREEKPKTKTPGNNVFTRKIQPQTNVNTF